MRNKLVLLLSLLFIISTTSCTSKKVESGDTDADAAEMTGDSSGDASATDTAKADGQAGNSDITDDFGTDDASKKDAASTDSAAAPKDNTAATPPPGGESDLAGLDDATAQPAPPPADNKDAQNLATNDAAAVPPPSDATPPVSDPGTAASPSTDETQGLAGGMGAPAADPKPIIPLQKMVTAPFTKKGIIANALYVARPGDTLKAVSEKIYGQDKSADLKKVNTAIAHRSLKVGDKVYYNSPQRPNDNTQMLTYYEDKGLAPEVYLAQAGDNLHAVGKKLLGDKNSWKELWVTNPDVESKSDLTEGTRLRYWSNEAAPTAPLADNPAAAPPGGASGTMANNTPPGTMANTAPPPAAMNAAPPPPPMPDTAAPPPPPAAMNAAPPPPPPAAANEPPPPPPAMANSAPPPGPKKAPKAAGADAKDAGGLFGGGDDDQMMALGVGVILLLAAAAMVIIIRKKRAKRAIDFQTASHTQIE